MMSKCVAMLCLLGVSAEGLRGLEAKPLAVNSTNTTTTAPAAKPTEGDKVAKAAVDGAAEGVGHGVVANALGPKTAGTVPGAVAGQVAGDMAANMVGANISAEGMTKNAVMAGGDTAINTAAKGTAAPKAIGGAGAGAFNAVVACNGKLACKTPPRDTATDVAAGAMQAGVTAALINPVTAPLAAVAGGVGMLAGDTAEDLVDGKNGTSVVGAGAGGALGAVASSAVLAR